MASSVNRCHMQEKVQRVRGLNSQSLALVTGAKRCATKPHTVLRRRKISDVGKVHFMRDGSHLDSLFITMDAKQGPCGTNCHYWWLP